MLAVERHKCSMATGASCSAAALSLAPFPSSLRRRQTQATAIVIAAPASSQPPCCRSGSVLLVRSSSLFSPSAFTPSPGGAALPRFLRLRNSRPLVQPAFAEISNLQPAISFSAAAFFSTQQQQLESSGEVFGRVTTSRSVWASASASGSGPVLPADEKEEVFFDGGVHYGDLMANLVFGLTLVWLPLTLAAVFRGLFLRYRFTNLRITIQSGLLGDDRKDFTYDVVKSVKFVPRFIGEWGDMAIELKDDTKVDVRSVPRFREIAKYIEERSAAAKDRKKGRLDPSVLSSTGITPRKGFS